MLFAFCLAVLDFSCKDVIQVWLVLSYVSFLQINTNLNFLFSSGSVYLFWFIFCGTFTRTGWLKSFWLPFMGVHYSVRVMLLWLCPCAD